MEIFLNIIISYLIGCIPSSYIIVKLTTGINIFEHGSGNPGALNSYESTGKKSIGIYVLIIDFLKGALAAYLSYLIAGSTIALYAGIIWVVIGNNYNIFFKGKGGRGLAVAAGAFAAVNPFIVVIWLLMWITVYFAISKNVHIANAAALIAAPILFFSSPSAIIELTNILQINDLLHLKITFALVCFIIVLRHIKPLKLLSETKED